MSYITKAELAKRSGRSEQFIGKQQNRIPAIINFVEVGKSKAGNPKIQVDEYGPLTIKFIIDCQEKGESSQKKYSNSNASPIINKPLQSQQVPKPEHATSEKFGTKEKHELEKRKLEEQIEQLQIKNEQTRATLVPKEMVSRVFSRIYEIDETQFKTLGVKIIDPISAVYNKENREKAKQILELIGKPDDNELRSSIVKILELGESDRKLEFMQILEDATMNVLQNIQREIDDFLKRADELATI